MNGKEVLVARKKRHQPDLACICKCWLYGVSARSSRVAYALPVCVANACPCVCTCVLAAARICNVRGVCCNLYSARLQFYLLHVFVANRAHTVYVKPRCWHVHATFPFQNRFWRRAPRRFSQRRRRFSGQDRTPSIVRHSVAQFLSRLIFMRRSYAL